MSAGPESRGGAFFGLIAAMDGGGAGVTAADVGCLPKSAQPPNGVSMNSARKIGPNARAARGIDRDSELCIVMGVVPPDIARLFLERLVVLRRVHRIARRQKSAHCPKNATANSLFQASRSPAGMRMGKIRT